MCALICRCYIFRVGVGEAEELVLVQVHDDELVRRRQIRGHLGELLVKVARVSAAPLRVEFKECEERGCDGREWLGKNEVERKSMTVRYLTAAFQPHESTNHFILVALFMLRATAWLFCCHTSSYRQLMSGSTSTSGQGVWGTRNRTTNPIGLHQQVIPKSEELLKSWHNLGTLGWFFFFIYNLNSQLLH